MKTSDYVASVIHRASIEMRVSHEEIVAGTFKAKHPSLAARRLVMLHLSRHGLSDELIGKAFKRATNTTRKHIQFAARCLEQTHGRVLSALPTRAIP